MIVTYHEIVDTSDCAYRYGVTTHRLDEHVQVIGNIMPHADKAAVTFDDGHASHYRYALPVLEQHGRRATFFVTVDGIGVRPEIMNWAQLREMQSLGHAIESHGWSHRFLTGCSENELHEELRRSRQVLEDGLGAGVEAISLPGGRWNDRVIQACAKEGYRCVYNSDIWRGPMRRSGILLTGRAMVRNNMDGSALAGLLHAADYEIAAMRARDAAMRGLIGLIGDRLYHALWCAWSHESERRHMQAEYTSREDA